MNFSLFRDSESEKSTSPSIHRIFLLLMSFQEYIACSSWFFIDGFLSFRSCSRSLFHPKSTHRSGGPSQAFQVLQLPSSMGVQRFIGCRKCPTLSPPRRSVSFSQFYFLVPPKPLSGIGETQGSQVHRAERVQRAPSTLKPPAGVGRPGSNIGMMKGVPPRSGALTQPP